MEVILQVSFSNSLYNKEAWAAEIVLQWMSQNASDDKWTLVKVMYWYHHLCCHMASLAHSELIFDMTVIICSKILSWDVLWRVLLYHFLQIISKNKPQLWLTMPKKWQKILLYVIYHYMKLASKVKYVTYYKHWYHKFRKQLPLHQQNIITKIYFLLAPMSTTQEVSFIQRHEHKAT